MAESGALHGGGAAVQVSGSRHGAVGSNGRSAKALAIPGAARGGAGIQLRRVGAGACTQQWHRVVPSGVRPLKGGAQQAEAILLAQRCAESPHHGEEGRGVPAWHRAEDLGDVTLPPAGAQALGDESSEGGPLRLHAVRAHPLCHVEVRHKKSCEHRSGGRLRGHPGRYSSHSREGRQSADEVDVGAQGHHHTSRAADLDGCMEKANAGTPLLLLELKIRGEKGCQHAHHAGLAPYPAADEEIVDVLKASQHLVHGPPLDAYAQALLHPPGGVQTMHEGATVDERGRLRVAPPHGPPGSSVHQCVAHSHKAVLCRVGEARLDVLE
eukprot:13642027-Alexandrium_andersonii.AAC.1